MSRHQNLGRWSKTTFDLVELARNETAAPGITINGLVIERSYMPALKGVTLNKCSINR